MARQKSAEAIVSALRTEGAEHERARVGPVISIWQELDGWIRRKLLGRLWRQCKRPYARARMLMRRGLNEERAWRSATNGRGARWNAGAAT